MHCIIEAMIGRGSDVALRKPEMYGIPPVLLGDPDRVRGILLNLSTNAAKFTKKGHITMKVSAPLNRRGHADNSQSPMTGCPSGISFAHCNAACILSELQIH